MVPAFSPTAANAAVKLSLFSSSSLKSSASRVRAQCLPLHKTTMQTNHHRLQYQANWASLASEINSRILESLPTAPPPAVAGPMQLLISAAPPSVAPALCLVACELVGGQRDQAMNVACAIQLMHAGAHAHTQFLRHECIVPRGVQIMTGDGILPFGYEMAARSGNQPERILRVIVEITRAMGPQGVVEGQLAEAEGRGGPEWAWERKGGQLSACGAACGAILGGGRDEDVEKLRRFGWYVGMLNEIMNYSSADDGERYCREVSGAFRSLAILELEGFDERKRDDVMGLFLGLECKETIARRTSPTSL